MRKHGLRLYSSDTRTWIHRDRALAAGNEAAHRWERLEPAERGDQPDADLIAMSLHRLRGAMVVDDVRELPAVPAIVAEGSVITPSSLPSDANAVWLVLREPDSRGIHLYDLLSREIEAEALAAGAPTLSVAGIDETVGALEELFAAALATGPCAQSVGERQLLLRDANLAQVEQVRGFYRRPWARGDPETIERMFLCECGRRSCTAEVQATVARAAAAPLLAHDR
jgi:hypothetical protein